MLLTISISVLVSKWKGHDTGHEKVLLWRVKPENVQV